MADPKDVPAPLSDRTLAHGRNVMAVASVIVVLAWVPYIELKSFKPLGFDIKEGGELSVWGILVVVLFYYAFRSAWEYYVDFRSWIDTYGARGSIPDQGADPRDYDKIRAARRVKTRRLKFKFWVLDVAAPTLLFLAALVATYQQIAPLVWPSPPPPVHTQRGADDAEAINEQGVHGVRFSVGFRATP